MSRKTRSEIQEEKEAVLGKDLVGRLNARYDELQSMLKYFPAAKAQQSLDPRAI